MVDMSILRSDEEKYFVWWLEEMLASGYILSYTYEENVYTLYEPVKSTWIKKCKKKDKVESLHLLNGAVYTPDFCLCWAPKSEGVFFSLISPMSKRPLFITFNKDGKTLSEVDVKGGGGSTGLKNASMHTFPLKQKEMWEKYGIFVNKVIPKDLFRDSFTPDRYLYTDAEGSTRLRKLKHKPKTLDEFALQNYKINYDLF
jgi:hypothetical protein